MTLPFKGNYPVTWTYWDHKANGGITADYAGTDFGLPYKTPLYATESGEISYSESGGEPYIVLYGATGTWFYVHVSSCVKIGRVNEGELIGYSGRPVNIGSGDHLHLGLQRGGVYVDPFPFLFNSTIETPDNMEKKVYTIQPGETLAFISEKLGVTLNQLTTWNVLSNPDLIYAGDVLIYYSDLISEVNSKEIQELTLKLKMAEAQVVEVEQSKIKEKEELKIQLEKEYANKIWEINGKLEQNQFGIEKMVSDNILLKEELEVVHNARKIQLSVSPHWTEEEKEVLNMVSQNLAVSTLTYISGKIKSIPKPFRILFYMMSGAFLLSLGFSISNVDYAALAAQYKGLAIPITVFGAYLGNMLVSYLSDLGEALKKKGEEESKDL